MRKTYQEMFSEVHASERLKTEARNVMKNTASRNTTRRIPAAALLAAVLVVALAGTALAAEYFGWLKLVRPVAPDELYCDNTRAGYQTEMVYDKIPADELSPEALAWISSVPETGEHAFGSRSFDSRQDAEEFLGLELADNALLEGMETRDSSFECDGLVYSSGPCLVVVTDGLPGLTSVLSYYQDGEYEISQTALLQFACPEQEERPATISNRIEGMGSFRSETYQTPGGLEAVLIIGDYAAHVDASFLWDGMLLKMSVNGGSVEGAMEEMKLILDAYE